jgi:diguanylate cyclase (GGDEF)-like protein
MQFVPSLDIRTAYMIGALASILSAIALYVLRDLHSRSRAGAMVMSAAIVCGGVCLIFAANRDSNTSAFSFWCGMVTAGAGFVLMHEAVRLLYGQAAKLARCALAITFLCLAFALIRDPKMTLLVHYACQVICSVSMVIILIRATDQQAKAARFAITFLTLCYVLNSSMRLIDTAYANNIVLLSPTFRAAGSFGLASILYALTSVIMMVLVMAVLNSRQIGDLTAIATTDELTGLSSRRYLIGQASTWRASMQAAKKSCALLMIDVDHFKSINDRFGHDVGDQVLRHVASTLRHNLREGTILARYGGEEFCALVPLEQASEAGAVAERLRHAIEHSPMAYGPGDITVTISIGVATLEAAHHLHDSILVADRRVYQAKDLGRNRVVSNDPAPGAAVIVGNALRMAV